MPRHVFLAVAVGVALLSVSGANAQDWPMHRLDANHSANADGHAIQQPHVRWTFPTGGDVYASPAVMDGTVYFGSTDRAFYAVTADTGKLVWKTQLPNPSGPVEDRYDENLTLDWKESLGKFQASPVVDGDRVYAITRGDGVLFAFKRSTGDEVWKVSLEGDGFSSPILVSNRLVVAAGQSIFALDPGTGSVLWRFNGYGRFHSSPASDGQRVYAGSLFGNFYALNLETGNLVWTKTVDAPFFPSPSINEGRVYIPDRRGELHVFDSETGKQLWNYKLPTVMEASPAIAGTRIFLADLDGNLFSIDIKTRTLQWSTVLPASVTKSSPTVIGDTVYVGTLNDHLVAVDARSGMLLWDILLGDKGLGIAASPVYSDGSLFIGSRSGSLYSIVEANGTPHEKASTIGFAIVSLALMLAVATRGRGP